MLLVRKIPMKKHTSMINFLKLFYHTKILHRVFWCSVNKVFVKILQNIFLKVSQASQENTCCQSLFFDEVAGWRQVLAQVFSCELCENFKNTFFINHLPGSCFSCCFYFRKSDSCQKIAKPIVLQTIVL